MFNMMCTTSDNQLLLSLLFVCLTIMSRHVAVLGQQGMRTLTGKAGKRFWMSEYGSGGYPVTDIKTGLALSTQASHC